MKPFQHLDHAVLAFLITSFAVVSGCDTAADRRAKIAKAEAQVSRIAAELDERTTETGVYVRAKNGEIKESDPWGKLIEVTYSRGGVAEIVRVRSAGPDQEFNTKDDISAEGMAVNLKGIGEGIKQNAEETAANAAKGLVKGTVEGVTESIKKALPFKSRDGDSAQPGKSKAVPDEAVK